MPSIFSKGVSHAPEARIVSSDSEREHQGNDGERLSAEASGGGEPQQSRQEQPGKGYPESFEAALERQEEIELGEPPKERDKRVGSTWDRGRKPRPTDSTGPIAQLSSIHEALIDYMVINPHHGLRELAARFGYSATWISQITNSDLFKARLRERRDAHFSRLSATLSEKIQAAADIGIERLGAMLEASGDPRFVKDATDNLLNRLGYGVQRAGVQVNAPGATIAVTSIDLEQARALMNRRETNVIPIEAKVIDDK